MNNNGTNVTQSTTQSTTKSTTQSTTQSTILSTVASMLNFNPPMSVASDTPVERLWPDVNDITTLISASEFENLRVPSETCKEAYNAVMASNTTAPMFPATADGWRSLDWSPCRLAGGKIVCIDDLKRTVVCHYFANPFMYDFPTIWEAGVNYDKPTRCSFQCNGYLRYVSNQNGGNQNGGAKKRISSELELLMMPRFAKEVAGSIPGIDVSVLSDEKIQELGLDTLYLTDINTNCSHADDPRRPQPSRAHISPPGCNCLHAALACDVQTPTGNTINWGAIMGINIIEEELAQYYTAYKRQNHMPTKCYYKCYQPIPNMTQSLLKYWNYTTAPSHGKKVLLQMEHSKHESKPLEG